MYNIKMDLAEIGWKLVGWIHLAEDRDQWRALVSMVKNHRISLKAGNSLASLTIVRFSRRVLPMELVG
jgi:hypothetical protein